MPRPDIRVSYSRNGTRYNWLVCHSRASLLAWLADLGDINDVYISIT